MKQPEFVALTHAKNGRQVYLLPTMIYYVEEDSKDNSTHIISGYGAILPVKETVEVVKNEITKALGGAVDE